MVRTLFSVTFLMSLVLASGAASAQEKNELTGIIGRTFVSDQAVTSVTAADNILHSGSGITLEANYGRRLMDLGIAGLTFEVPFVINFKQDLRFALNLVPKDYRSFFVTPSIRANVFPHSGISPWVSAGILARTRRWSLVEQTRAQRALPTECSRSAWDSMCTCLAV